MNKFIFSLIALAALSPSGYAKRAFTIQDAYRTIGVGSLSPVSYTHLRAHET